jgi:protein-S-isoprenylcysteine O-methyltransferase Ste14
MQVLRSNPFAILLGAFVVAVHHAIVLAEENHIQKVFSREYAEYCSHVRRYV